MGHPFTRWSIVGWTHICRKRRRLSLRFFFSLYVPGQFIHAVEILGAVYASAAPLQPHQHVALPHRRGPCGAGCNRQFAQRPGQGDLLPGRHGAAQLLKVVGRKQVYQEDPPSSTYLQTIPRYKVPVRHAYVMRETCPPTSCAAADTDGYTACCPQGAVAITARQ